MSASPSPSAVLAQCVLCEWQGWIEPAAHSAEPAWVPPQYLNAYCARCGAARLIDRSTQAPASA